jgi:hypothetical protein
VLQTGGNAIKIELAKPVTATIGLTYETQGLVDWTESKRLVIREALLRPSAVPAEFEFRTANDEWFDFHHYGDALVKVTGKVVASAQIADNYVGTLTFGHRRVVSVLQVAAAGGGNPFQVGSITETIAVAEFSGRSWGEVEEIRLLNRSPQDIRIISVATLD